MNKPTVNSAFQFVSDGSSLSISVNLTTSPVYYNLPSQNSSLPVLNGAFSLSATGVINIFNDASLTVTSASVALGVLTISFSSMVVAGQIVTVYATLEF